jgi:small subunit ribosomal protein S16
LAAKIKLQRKGSKKRPIYNVVVQDESAATNAMVIETLGRYNTLVDPAVFDVNKEKTEEWLKKGAKPTDKVRILLGKAGILPPVDLASLHKRKSRADIKAEEQAKAAGKGKEGEASAETPSEAKTEPAKEAPKAEEKPKEEPKEQPKEEPKEQPKEEVKPS